MAQAYFSLVTATGKIKLAQSAAGGSPVVITHFAIGDGNGAETNPTAATTALVREVWRTPVESVVTDPSNPSAILVTAIIPTNAGGWWMREFGVFDNTGSMIAVARPVSQYKPTALEGQLEDIRYEFQIIIGESANVTLLVDPSLVFATREWVQTRKIPMAQLSLTPWVPVKSMTVTAPTANPTAWETYVVPAGATGAWAGHAQKLAEWNGTAWNIVVPPDGHGVSLPDGRVFEKVGGVYIEKLALDTQTGKWNYAVAGGSADQLSATLIPAPSAYVSGMGLKIKVLADNTGPATIDVNGLGARPIIRASDMSTLKGSDLVNGRIASITYDGSSWLLSDVVTALAPLNRYFNRAGTSSVATVSLTPAAAGAMHYGLLSKAITYNLPPATDFGVGYIGFMNNIGLGVTINAAVGVDRDEFQFINNPKLKTITLSDAKSWVVLFCDGANWLFFSGDIGLNAKLGQSLSDSGYKMHDGGLIEQWGTSVVTTTSSAYGTVYFPKRFPNRTFMVVAGSAMGNSGIANKVMSVFDTAAPDAFNFYADASSTTLRINWMAKGC